jgi:hypothetical protein
MLTAPPSCGIASGMTRPETTKIPEAFTARGIKTWGLTIASVSAKAYWARDRVNGGHGEP